MRKGNDLVVKYRWVAYQVAWARRSMADRRSLLRYVMDLALYPALRILPTRLLNGERRIRLSEGVELTYRLNRGDIQGIREVWVEECYLPPNSANPEVVVDLGANIGLTSVFLAKRYGWPQVVAVEPDPGNCRILEKNFSRNSICGSIIQAAVGSISGTGYFQPNIESNLGSLSESGVPVQVLTMVEILDQIPSGTADLVKMDIEGGEGDVLSGDLSWLRAVGAMIVEFHPGKVDYEALLGVLTAAGFTYLPRGSLGRTVADSFVRVGADGAGAGAG